MAEASGAFETGETHTPRRRHPGLPAVGFGLLVVGWSIVAVLGLVALLRLVAWDSVEPLIVLNALNPIVYLPAWGVIAGALVARRWWLAAAAAVIIAAQAGIRRAGAIRCDSRAYLGSTCPGGAGIRRKRR